MFIFRSILTIPVAIVLSLAHAGCCLLPLMSVAATSFSYFSFLQQYRFTFTIIQFAVLIFLLIRIVMHYFIRNQFHSKLEKFSYHLSLVVTLSGLLINYLEPFKTENQKIAQQQFVFFKLNRELLFEVTNQFDQQRLMSDLSRLKGIKSGRTQITNRSVRLIFKSDETSVREIFSQLKANGYEIDE